RNIREKLVPRLAAARREWRRRVLWHDGIVFGSLLLLLLVLSVALGWWRGLSFQPPWLDTVLQSPLLLWGGLALLVLGAWQLHRVLRRHAARKVERRLRADTTLGEEADSTADAFAMNVRSWW